MPLYFTDKKNHWPPSKPVQYILAFSLLLIAILILGGWLYFRFVYVESNEPNTDSDSTTIDMQELPETSYCLVIVEDTDHERFALVKASPKDDSIIVTPLSPTMKTSDGELHSSLKKHGIAQTAQLVANALDIPTIHYMSFSIADVETLFTHLGTNLKFTIAENVSYQDENGATIRLAAETHRLTPSQIASLLRYTQWEDLNNEMTLAADITAAVINQCLLPGQSLKGYFELLSNTAVTDLRIDQFNAYLLGLEHLVSVNDGEVARCADMIN